jgi:hypothetical protein
MTSDIVSNNHLSFTDDLVIMLFWKQILFKFYLLAYRQDMMQNVLKTSLINKIKQ